MTDTNDQPDQDQTGETDQPAPSGADQEGMTTGGGDEDPRQVFETEEPSAYQQPPPEGQSANVPAAEEAVAREAGTDES